jgi:hypothetical protein
MLTAVTKGRSVTQRISLLFCASAVHLLGYTVDGLQELNYNVDNESGSFVSSAKMDGNKLVFSTQKIYKKNYDKKEQWPNYVAFLEAAYRFTQAKVVLKKQQ